MTTRRRFRVPLIYGLVIPMRSESRAGFATLSLVHHRRSSRRVVARGTIQVKQRGWIPEGLFRATRCPDSAQPTHNGRPRFQLCFGRLRRLASLRKGQAARRV